MKRYPLPDIDTVARTVILADGGFPAEGTVAAGILASAGYVVCCDGAADGFIARGGVPAAIVGDCDSMSPETARKYAHIVFRDPDQQTNDLTKAFAYCLERGREGIVILGATGRREDHTLGNISLLADYARRTPVCMITDNGVFDAIYSPSRFDSFPGQQVSLFTIGTGIPVVVENLLYDPPAAGLSSWWPGTLNQSLGETFTVRTEGPALVFRVFTENPAQL